MFIYWLRKFWYYLIIIHHSVAEGLFTPLGTGGICMKVSVIGFSGSQLPAGLQRTGKLSWPSLYKWSQFVMWISIQHLCSKAVKMLISTKWPAIRTWTQNFITKESLCTDSFRQLSHWSTHIRSRSTLKHLFSLVDKRRTHQYTIFE